MIDLYTIINKMEKANNQTLDGNDSQQNEKTFTKLQRIQSLLKKESALKKLCKNIFINKSSFYNI